MGSGLLFQGRSTLSDKRLVLVELVSGLSCRLWMIGVHSCFFYSFMYLLKYYRVYRVPLCISLACLLSAHPVISTNLFYFWIFFFKQRPCWGFVGWGRDGPKDRQGRLLSVGEPRLAPARWLVWRRPAPETGRRLRYRPVRGSAGRRQEYAGSEAQSEKFKPVWLG